MKLGADNRVAILLATYNGEKYLREQLDSLLKQSYPHWTAYIHDDGSNDDTLSIISEYVKKYPKHFIQVSGASTGGACKNFMYLIHSVEADVYMCCDQDDVWLENKIALTLKALLKMKNIDSKPCLVHTDLKVVNGDLEVISESMNCYQKLNCADTSLSHLLVQNTVTGCTMMFNRKLRDAMIKLKNNDAIIMHDWWAGLIAAQFGTLRYLNIPTILYRQHGDNSVGAKRTTILSVFTKFNREEQNQTKDALKNTRKQARELISVYKLPKNSLPYIYGNIAKLSKLKRICIYRRYGFRKSSLIKTLGLYYFG